MKIRHRKLLSIAAQWTVGAVGLVVALTAHAVPYAISSDGNAVVRIIPQTSAPALDTSLVTGAYPGWTVTNGAAAGGSFSTSNYTAGWAAPSGGAQFEGSYSQTNAVAAGGQLNYIQIIQTNVPLNGATSPYIDPQPNDDTLPFYWTKSEAVTSGTPTSVSFSDFSKRDPASLASTNPITWTANLYPVAYDGATTVVAGTGVQWGWTMKPATVGNAAATFNAPSPTCPPATCSGIGTSAISWGIGSPGSLSFAGSSFAPKVGDPFKLGTLSYTNGATTEGSALDGIGLDIALSFDNVPEANFVYHTGLSITNTPNTDDPIASADFVKFTTGAFPYTFNVLEGSSASVDVIARFLPSLAITPAAAIGDKDPFAILDPTSVLGFDLELVALVSPSDGGFVPGVPEPGTYSLLLIALMGAFAQRAVGRQHHARWCERA